jgi:phosphatidylglycerophosphate synthase
MFFIYHSKEVSDIQSDFVGKLKTTFQMIGIGFILITPLTPSFIFDFSLALIFFSALISWYSFAKYSNNWFKKS